MISYTDQRLVNFLLEDLFTTKEIPKINQEISDLNFNNSDLVTTLPQILQRDLTSFFLEVEKNKLSRYELVSKQSGTLSGLDLFKKIFKIFDRSVQIKFYKKNSDSVIAGDLIASVKGANNSILLVERSALNLLTHLSGLATQTKKYVNLTKNSKTKILDTRKTIPGLRDWQKKAVKDGGGINHRLGLYDGIMIKNNHIDSSSSLEKILDNITKKNVNNYPLFVEVRNLRELNQVLKYKNQITRIMLDNMNLKKIKTVVKSVNKQIPLEVTGNMNLKKISLVSQTGVDYISVGGALTMEVPRLDLSLRFKFFGK